MLLKHCCQYARKFGKLSSDHRTGKHQFSLQSQRKAMPKNVQIFTQLQLFHMLAKLWSKSFKLGFSSTWNENFQMYNLDLEKAEEPEIKLSSFAETKKKQRNSKTTSSFASLTMLKLLTVDHNKLWNILEEMGIPDHLTCLLRNLYTELEAIVRTGLEQRTGSKLGKEYYSSRLYIVILCI